MPDYSAIFEAALRTVLQLGGQNWPQEDVQKALDQYNQPPPAQPGDDWYFERLVWTVFYVGIKADDVFPKMSVILHHLGNYQKVAKYTQQDVAYILADPRMLGNQGKIQACIKNAQEFQAIVQQHGSFQAYLDSFQPHQSEHNREQLRADLQRFAYFGPVNTYHFLKDIGIGVLKPDQVIRRLFYRLGLVPTAGDSEQELKLVLDVGQQIAAATSRRQAYVDRVFVALGQASSKHELGIDQGVCFENKPRCSLCGLREYCVYYQGTQKATPTATTAQQSS
jgi:DNA-3-methyladenine glycosylase I